MGVHGLLCWHFEFVSRGRLAQTLSKRSRSPPHWPQHNNDACVISFRECQPSREHALALDGIRMSALEDDLGVAIVEEGAWARLWETDAFLAS